MIDEIYLLGASIAFLLFCLCCTIGTALKYFGILESINVKTGTAPFPFAGAEIAYKVGKGKANDSGAVFTEACSILPGKPTVGLYLELEEQEEDPNGLVTLERRTRFSQFTPSYSPVSEASHYVVGVITTPSPNYRPEAFTTHTSVDDEVNKPATEEERALLREKGFTFAILPASTASDNMVYATFPFRGVISTAIGIRRVFSNLTDYIEHHRLCAYPLIELYDRDTIYYMMPLSQQDLFTSLFTSNSPHQQAEALIAAAANSNNSDSDSTENDINDDEETEIESNGGDTSGSIKSSDDSEDIDSPFEEL